MPPLKLLISSLLIFLFLIACGESEVPTPSKETSGGGEVVKKTAVKRPRQMRHCIPCHNLKKGQKHKIGPTLFDVVGRKVGSAPGFKYSKAFAEGDWLWTRENIRLIISKSTGAATEAIKSLSGDPKAKTNMKFYGASDKDAEKILDYLETLKD